MTEKFFFGFFFSSGSSDWLVGRHRWVRRCAALRDCSGASRSDGKPEAVISLLQRQKEEKQFSFCSQAPSRTYVHEKQILLVDPPAATPTLAQFAIDPNCP